MRRLRTAALPAVALVLLCSDAYLAAQHTDPPPLVTRVRTSSMPLTDARNGIVTRELVDVDLEPLGGAYGALAPAPLVRLNLLPGVDVVASLTRIEQARSGISWVGTVADDPLSSVVFAIVNGSVAGTVLTRGRHYDVQSAGGGVVISEIDDRLFDADDTVRAQPPDSPRLRPHAAATPPDDPQYIDLLAVYTPAAAAALGGENGVRARIQAGVAYANTAYRNSGVDTTLRLVCAEQTSYVESGDSTTDLQRLTNPDDGYMDDVHALRDTCGADAVTLVAKIEPAWCGRGWVGSRTSQTPFSIIDASCAAGPTLAHELGHNFGLQHDWYMTSSAGAWPFSHGFVDLAGGVLDIMAYGNMCADARVPCTSIPYFANPGLTYHGRPIGTAAGTNTSCTAGNLSNPPCDADGTRTINETAPILANQRYSRTSGSTLAFPPRNETYDFRQQLDAKYRDGLRRSPAISFADVEGSVVWTQEYLMYRVQACSHQQAIDKVRIEIAQKGLPAVCGTIAPGEIAFPPRNEALAFRQQLETIYRDELKRAASASYVDMEGDVVWIQEYIRYRLTGCDHGQATSRVMTQIDGGGIMPGCR